jgi:hypothetical protein
MYFLVGLPFVRLARLAERYFMTDVGSPAGRRKQRQITKINV